MARMIAQENPQFMLSTVILLAGAAAFSDCVKATLEGAGLKGRADADAGGLLA